MAFVSDEQRRAVFARLHAGRRGLHRRRAQIKHAARSAAIAAGTGTGGAIVGTALGFPFKQARTGALVGTIVGGAASDYRLWKMAQRRRGKR